MTQQPTYVLHNHSADDYSRNSPPHSLLQTALEGQQIYDRLQITPQQLISTPYGIMPSMTPPRLAAC